MKVKAGGYFERALKKYAKWVTQEAKQNLRKSGFGKRKKPISTSGKLYDSIGYKIVGQKVTFNSLYYGELIDKGVRGMKSTYPQTAQAQTKAKEHYKFSRMPPSSAFDKWGVRKGIAPRDEKGRFLKRKGLNYIIARSVGNKGIRASLFFTKPFERALDLFGDSMLDGYYKDKIGIE